MKKILATGFVPFAGMDINPAGEIVQRLQQPENAELVTKILPVEYERTRIELKKLLEQERPDAVVSFGQGGTRKGMTPEYVAINFATTRSTDGRKIIADEAGLVMDDVKLDEEGDTAYITTLPVRKMVAASNEIGVQANLSYTAGTYLCNATMYTSLREAALKYPEMQAGFVHTPYLPEQMPDSQADDQWPRMYAMPLEDMVTSAQAMINAIADNL